MDSAIFLKKGACVAHVVSATLVPFRRSILGTSGKCAGVEGKNDHARAAGKTARETESQWSE